MQKTTNPADELRNLLTNLLPPDVNYKPVVNAEMQQIQLQLLNERIDKESFYFVFNLATCSLEHVKGVEKWLGYPDSSFTVDKYLRVVHPGQAVQFNMIAQSMYNILCKGKFKLQFSTQRYISLIALQPYKGEPILFKKITSIFQYDGKDRLLAQLNEFQVVDKYRKNPLGPRVTEINGLPQKDDFEALVFSMVLKTFMKRKFFSVREFQILKLYADTAGITTRDVADLLDISQAAIKTYNRRILEKAVNIFTHSFTEAKEVAMYLKSERIL